MNSVLIIANLRKSQGGITTQVLELEKSLNDDGIKAEIVSTHGSSIERIYGLFSSFFKSKNYDIILGVGCAYFGFLPILVAFVISFLRNKPVVYNFHDGQVKEFLKYNYDFVNIVLKKRKVIVATKYLYDIFKLYGFNAEIIHNHFNNLEIVDPEISNSEIIKVIWARSFEKLYRVDLALDTARFFNGKRKIEFHFYGGGSEYNYYKDKYNDSNIYFHGILQRNELLKEYAKYSIFLNTSEYDNFPMSIVEAGLNNLIVVSSKIGGIETIYSENEIKYFKSGDLDDLIRTFDALTCELSKYKSFSNNLTNKVISFSWENVKEKWLEALKINIQ